MKDFQNVVHYGKYAGLALAVASVACPELGLAGTEGEEFDGILDTIQGFVAGVPGRIITVTSFLLALIGSAVKFNPYAIAGSVGIGLGTTAVGAISDVATALV